MNILRLSLFRLKKNKKEAVAIAFLTMITTFMLALCTANYTKSNKAYDDSFAASGSPDTCVFIKNECYRDEYLDVLKNDFHIEDVTETEMVYATAKDVLRKH